MTEYSSKEKELGFMALSYLASSEFIIPTNSIYELRDQINEWFVMGVCGAIICGRSRVGKTSAISYLMKDFKEKYGEEFPVLLWSISEKSVGANDKSFYANLLDTMGITIPNYNRMNSLEMKNRVVNYIAIQASISPIKKAIMIIDEAYKLGMKEYYWLMDIYNILNFRYHVILNVFLFGTPREMHAMRDNFKTNKQTQIVERFLLNEYNFKGICTKKELGYCLAELDRTEIRGRDDNYYKLAECFFPEAFNQEHLCFYHLTDDYWEAFQKIKGYGKISVKDIPMQYFMQSFILCLSSYGHFGKNKHYFPTYEDILLSIEKTGYGRSADE